MSGRSALSCGHCEAGRWVGFQVSGLNGFAGNAALADLLTPMPCCRLRPAADQASVEAFGLWDFLAPEATVCRMT